MMRAADIASSIGDRWPAVHEYLGIAREFLVNRHGPCPACGGRDRYRYDNRRGRGSYYCNGCGAGDGFTLLQRVFGWDFRTARARVIEAAGIADDTPKEKPSLQRDTPKIARPSARVLRLRDETCSLGDCPDVVEYLKSRCVWPWAARTSLRAHPGLDYYQDGIKLGRYPALLAAVRDIDSDLVTIHATFLDGGRKIDGNEARKILSPMVGRDGCAVRLQLLSGSVLGIGEGIETCLSAAILHHLPVWAALNTSMLAKFTPPQGVDHVVIFADRDTAGLEAAGRLSRRLQATHAVEICLPPDGCKDWNDAHGR